MNTQTGPAAVRDLEVGAVTVDVLPATPLTADASECYTVSAVFSNDDHAVT